MDSETTLGAEIDALLALKQKKAGFEAQAKDVEAEISAAEQRLLDRMDTEGVTRAAGAAGAVYVDESIYPSVEDWDEFYKFIFENRYFHLLERRPSVGGCRELFELNQGRIPGVQPFAKRRPKVSPIKTR